MAVSGESNSLVQRFPGGISVPLAVWREVVETGRGRPGANAVATASWISVEAVRDASRARIFALTLDEGESEALALAVEKSADVVLLDEKDARQMAEKIGLAPLGTVGLLVWARRVGLIANLRVELEALRDKVKFRISDALVASALRAAGET